jgi:mRNA-degrading endonuclease RelE of RelBE toxin-antitoxin system
VRVRAALERFADTGAGDVRRLVDPGKRLRLRVGDWRVILALDDDPPTVRVLRVLHRREAYRE